MKTFTMTVRYCNECPNRSGYYEPYCKAVKVKDECPKDIPTLGKEFIEIPDWCPLKEAKA